MKNKFSIGKVILSILIIAALISFIIFLAIMSKKNNNDVEENKFEYVDLNNEIVKELYNSFTDDYLTYLYDFNDIKIEKIEYKDLKSDVKNYIAYKFLTINDEVSCSSYLSIIPEGWYCSNEYLKNGINTFVIDEEEMINSSNKYFGDYSISDFNIETGVKYFYNDGEYILISTKKYDCMGVQIYKEFSSAKINDSELFIDVHFKGLDSDNDEYMYTYHFNKNDNGNYIFDYLDKKEYVNE